MVNPLLFIAGAIVVAVVLYDFLKTTISLSGLGPISSRIAHGLWRIAPRVALLSEQRLGWDVRGLIGPLILTALAVSWIFIPLLGYTAMYAAGQSLNVSGTNVSATLIDKIAFSGSALSTLGASIVTPTGGWWDFLSMIAAINGMIVLTLEVSFILNVLQTTMEARGLALRVHALIRSGEPEDRRRTLQRIAPLGSDFCSVAVKLSASPLPGMFVPSDPTMDFPGAVTRVCDLCKGQDSDAESCGSSGDHAEELNMALVLLGHHVGSEKELNGVEAAHAWALRFSLPHKIGTESTRSPGKDRR